MRQTTTVGPGTLSRLPEGLKEWVGVITAIMFLIGYLVLNYLLFSQQLELQEQAWSRAMVLYTSVESIALTAAGYLFGREVNRERAARAEQQADQTQQQVIAATQEAAQEAAKGRALATTIEQLATTSISKQEQHNLEATDPEATIKQIRQVTRSFYP
jgi:hypothetical protein